MRAAPRLMMLVVWFVLVGSGWDGVQAQTGTGDRLEADKNPFRVEAKPGATLERDYRKRFHAWSERHLTPAAKERMTGKAWEAEGSKYVEDAVDFLMENEARLFPLELRRRGLELEKAGCDEPLVLLLTARCVGKSESSGRDAGLAKHLLERANEEVKRQKAPGFIGAIVAWENATTSRTTSRTAKQPFDDEAVKRVLEAALKEKIFGGDDAAVLLRFFDAGAGQSHFDRVHERYAAMCEPAKDGAIPGWPEWARATLQGLREKRLAWDARGGGYADTVSEAGWKQFEFHLARAVTELEAAWKLRPDQPYAAAQMVPVKMGQGNSLEEVNLWFERAIAAQFDYGRVYDDRMWALRPRWGGSPGLMLAFGAACMDTDRYDTAVPNIFMKACNDLMGDLEGNWQAVYRQPEIARRIAAHQRKLLAEPTDAHVRWVNRAFAAVNGWAIRDYALAEDALRELKPAYFPSSAVEKLNAFDETERDLRAEVSVRRSPVAPQYAEAEKAIEEKEFEAAAKALEELLPQTPKEGRRLVESRLARLAVAQALPKHEWVKLPVKPDLPGWRLVDGPWVCEADGTMRIQFNGGNPLILFEEAPGENYELRGEMSGNVVRGGEATVLQPGGVVLGSRGYWDSKWLDAYLTTIDGRSVGTLRKQWSKLAGAPETPVTFATWTPFQVRVEQGKVTFTANGTPVAENFPIGEYHADGEKGLIGFTSYSPPARAVWRIRNIEVRQLP